MLDLFNEKKDFIHSSDIENVELEKQEYKFIGRFLRRKGLRLYSYSSLKNELKELKIEYGNILHIVPDGNGGLTVIDPEMEKITIDSSETQFEALNLRTAKDRLRKFKAGKIKELCNLRTPGEGINFY